MWSVCPKRDSASRGPGPIRSGRVAPCRSRSDRSRSGLTTTSAASLAAALTVATLALSAAGAPYKEIAEWGRLPEGQHWAEVAGMAVSDSGTVYALHRADPPIVELDTSGTILRTWGEKLFVKPHGVRVDREGFLWMTDYQAADGRGAQVFKYTQSGRLVMTLGRPGGGQGVDEFSGPADVAVAANGDIFVADGHGSNRILKFTAQGRFIKAWGGKGSGPGEFSIAHCVVFDSRGRLFVCDPLNHRIQIFDQDGRFLDQWTQFESPSGLFITADDTLYAVDNCCSKATLIGSAQSGSVRYRLETPGEAVAVGRDGAIYIGEVPGRTVRKFVKIDSSL
jgi:DNA-binding beta-propeller fold protein YncE